jgi:hypothetical protein
LAAGGVAGGGTGLAAVGGAGVLSRGAMSGLLAGRRRARVRAPGLLPKRRNDSGMNPQN